MNFKRVLPLVLGLMMFLSATLGQASPAQAKSSRAAQIKEIVGEVFVTKAGGSKSYKAFEGMTLNQGDHVKTGSGAKLVLEITDHDDEITIDQNASLYISELQEEKGGKKSKVKMWAGSLWSKVKTLAGAEDEFEVETPTAVMGVRGTNLFVGVDPVTGDATFMIASGLGEVSQTNGSIIQGALIYPSQQLFIPVSGETTDLGNNVSVVDLDTFVSTAGPGVIEAIVKNKAALDQENAEFVEGQQKLINEGKPNEKLGVANQADLQRISNNLDNLIGNIVKKAIETNKVDEKKIHDVINQVNTTLEKKINLDTVKPLDLTAEQQKKLEELKRQEELRKIQLEAEKKRQEELKRQNEELLKKLAEQLKKQEEARKKAEEEAKRKAEEELKKKLDDAAKAAFEKAKAELEKKQEEQKKAAEQNTTINNNPTTPTGTTGGSGSGSNGPSGPVLKGELSLRTSSMTNPSAGTYTFNVDVMLKDISDIFAVQLHFITDPSVATGSSVGAGEIFIEGSSTSVYKKVPVTVDGQSKLETIFAITQIPSASSISVGAAEKKLVSLPIQLVGYSSSKATIKLPEVIIVKSNGDRISIANSTTQIEVNLPATTS